MLSDGTFVIYRILRLVRFDYHAVILHRIMTAKAPP